MRNFILLVGLLVSFGSAAQHMSLNTTSVDFGVLNENDLDSFKVVVYNHSDNYSDPIDYQVTDMDVFGLFGHNPFFYTDSTLDVLPGDSASFWVYANIRHNIINKSVLVIKTNSPSGALKVDLTAQGRYTNTYYNSTENLSEDQLKSEFATLLANGYTTLSYNAARDDMFMTIDNQAVNGQGASQNTLECVYTGTQITGFSNRSQAQNMGFNTEHTFPQGQFNSNQPMRADLHHLFPTTATSNSTRSNYRFGEVVNATWTQGGSKLGTNGNGDVVFEPRDPQKGVAARAMLYFVMRHDNYNGYLNTQEGILKTWSKQFPPNGVEEQRNDDIFAVQGNRNPFIDYPQFADRISNFSSNTPPATNPDLYLSENTIIIHDGTYLNVDTVDYGVVLVNPGTFTTSLSNVQITGAGFSLPNYQGGNINIQANEGFRLIVRSTEGVTSGTLSFETNILGQGTVNIPIDRIFIGVDEEEKSGVRLYPNPATNRVRVENVAGSYQLISVDGRVVLSGSSDTDFTLDVSSISPGVYFFKAENQVHRLIVQ